jgi:acyl-CoA hydrolase
MLLRRAGSPWARHLRRPFSSSSDSDRPAPKTRGHSSGVLAEIVGDISRRGMPNARLPAGDVLRLIDIAAARTAFAHAAPAAGSSSDAAAQVGCVTLSFDRVDLMVPILHGDLLEFSSSLLSVGRSSMVVQVVGRKKDVHTRSWVPTSCSLVTFVAIDGVHKRATAVAPLALGSGGGGGGDGNAARRMEAQVAERAALAREWEAAQVRVREACAAGELSAVRCEEARNAGKSERLRLSDTAVQLQKTWMPRSENVHGSIFGGDLLAWMEQAALYCATSFTRNTNMVTINMGRVFFFEPIHTTDMVELEATAVYATEHTVQIEVVVHVEKGGLLHDHPAGATAGDTAGRLKTSHRGHFTVLNLDELGRKRPVTTGFDLENASAEELSMFEQGKQRHQFFTARDRRVEMARLDAL